MEDILSSLSFAMNRLSKMEELQIESNINKKLCNEDMIQCEGWLEFII